jgi:hypothetical protein
MMPSAPTRVDGAYSVGGEVNVHKRAHRRIGPRLALIVVTLISSAAFPSPGVRHNPILRVSAATLQAEFGIVGLAGDPRAQAGDLPSMRFATQGRLPSQTDVSRMPGGISLVAQAAPSQDHNWTRYPLRSLHVRALMAELLGPEEMIAAFDFVDQGWKTVLDLGYGQQDDRDYFLVCPELFVETSCFVTLADPLVDTSIGNIAVALDYDAHFPVSPPGYDATKTGHCQNPHRLINDEGIAYQVELHTSKGASALLVSGAPVRRWYCPASRGVQARLVGQGERSDEPKELVPYWDAFESFAKVVAVLRYVQASHPGIWKELRRARNGAWAVAKSRSGLETVTTPRFLRSDPELRAQRREWLTSLWREETSLWREERIARGILCASGFFISLFIGFEEARLDSCRVLESPLPARPAPLSEAELSGVWGRCVGKVESQRRRREFEPQ